MKLTHCKRGHEFTTSNTIRNGPGGRACKICNAAYQKLYRKSGKRKPYGRAYYLAHLEKFKLASKKRYMEKREEIIKKSIAYRRRNPEKRKAYLWNRYLRKKYHLTQAGYDALLKSQNGLCAICEKKPARFHIDHDHKTGAVRGLLCPGCNLGIARFDQNLHWAVIALDYVISRRSEVDIKKITSVVMHFFHHIEVFVSEAFIAIFGDGPAHAFAVGAESLLHSELGKLAMIAVQEVESMASGAEKMAAAFEKVAAGAKAAGLTVKDSLIRLLIEVAVARLKGMFGQPG